MNDVWTRWEGHVIDGTLPLLRCLGASDHSGVFLTEPRSGGVSKAALKLVPVIPSLVDAQLSHWRTAAALSHPRLLQLYDSGRCQLGERHFLFLVMEYAEQNLAEVLPHRALTADEAREMLIPTLDALSFLHERKLVQGQVKPTNILVVGDQLKLASDTIRPASEATANIGMPSVYDAPETGREIFTTAVDIWSLGATLIEALTQRAPSWKDDRRAEVLLAPDFAPTFAQMVRLCLSYEPDRRPDVTALKSWIEGNANALTERAGAPSGRVAADERLAPARKVEPRPNPAAAREPQLTDAAMHAREPQLADLAVHAGASEGIAPRMTTERLDVPPRKLPAQGGGHKRLAPAILGLLTIALAVWGAVHLLSGREGSQPAPVRASWGPPAPEVKRAGEIAPRAQESARAERESAPPASPTRKSANANRTTSSAVLHEEIPNVSKHSRDTIHGHVRVVVKVTVDRSGRVVSDTLEDAGPSHYFARVASQAARKWKFSPSDDQTPRVWRIRFEFGREGTTAHAVQPRTR